MPAFEVADPLRQQEAPFPPAASSSVLTRLRQETRAEHEAVEQVLDLMAPSLSRDGYCQRLKQFYGFYAPLEQALRAWDDCAKGPADHTGLSISMRAALDTRLTKTALLREDLACLGVSVEALPLCQSLPPLARQTEVLGCLYVLEGATLGGRMISQHVRATLGITPAGGGSFFEGYGAGTGQMWQAMRQLLVSGAPDASSANEMVASAIATFTGLRGWCQSVQTRTTAKTARHA